MSELKPQPYEFRNILSRGEYTNSCISVRSIFGKKQRRKKARSQAKVDDQVNKTTNRFIYARSRRGPTNKRVLIPLIVQE